MIEIGNLGVWTLSSAKQGNGVEALRDNNLNTYWQSDGPQPHTISAQFSKVTSIQEVRLYLDHKKDESYTPQLIHIKIGSNFNDLKTIKIIELDEPNGWIKIQFDENIINCFMLQIVILQNHSNGRDTHLRQIKIYGPDPYLINNEYISNEFTMYSMIR